MADEFNEDEYHFTEVDASGVFDEETSSSKEEHTPTKSENNLKKVILMGIGVLLVGSLGYKFLGSIWSGSNTKREAVQEQQASHLGDVQSEKNAGIKVGSVADHTPKPVTQPVQAISMPEVHTITKTITDPKLNEKLDSLQAASSSTSRSIGSINSNISQLQQMTQSLATKLNALNANLVILSQALEQQEAQLKKLTAKPKKKEVKKSTAPVKRKIFFIQALIPGRAWLKSTEGETITVVKGTDLKGYGKVHSIDPRKGEVLTSSGSIITFSISDT